MEKKHGQMWFTDFFIALLIFFFVLISYYTYIANISKQSSSVFDELISETKTISPTLLLEGNPSTWTNETVIRIGLTKNDERIDNTLLIEASKISYNRTKKLLGVVHDFFVFFENKDGRIVTFAGEFGLGSPDVIFNSSVNMAYYYQQEGQDDRGRSGRLALLRILQDWITWGGSYLQGGGNWGGYHSGDHGF